MGAVTAVSGIPDDSEPAVDQERSRVQMRVSTYFEVVSRGMSTEFCDLTLAAATAWRTLALVYANTGGYMPRETLPCRLP